MALTPLGSECEQNVVDLHPPHSVLLVEPESVVADGIASSVIRCDYRALPTAASASAAIEAAAAQLPDSVKMDVRMGGGDNPVAVAAAVEQALSHQRSLLAGVLAGVLGGMSDAVAAADVDGNIIVVNEAGRRAFGQTMLAKGSSRHSNPRLYLPDGQTRLADEDRPLARALAGENVREAELFVRSSEYPLGRYYSVNATPLLDAQGLLCGAVEVARDSTELRAAHSRLQEQSETDPLTGAYNRRGFMRVGPEVIEHAYLFGLEPRVFLLDLNGMKKVNDSLGHSVGDRLLVDMTTILRDCFQESGIVGRLGGDEFVVLSLGGPERADELVARLRTTVAQFNADSERSYRVSFSIGLSTGASGAPPSLDALVEEADRRMYEDKVIRSERRASDKAAPVRPRASTSPSPRSTPSLAPRGFKATTRPTRPNPRLVAGETADPVGARGERTENPENVDPAPLRDRFDRAMDGLWMAMQPIVSIRTPAVYGYEALLRTTEASLANPLEFLDAAEKLGATHTLGRAIRAKVAEAASSAPNGVRLFVNIHGGDLDDFELYSSSSPLSAFADRVVLEVTERRSLDAVTGLSRRLAKLREAGFQLAVDDLGAGYAGLSSFWTLEPDFVKLEMSVVRGVDVSKKKQSVIRAMLSLCENDLGMRVICEGVETAAERNTLAVLGCDLVQGYLFGRPAKVFTLA